jgi:hypothetical protein
MGIFNRVDAPTPTVKAAAGWSNAGAGQIGNYFSYQQSIQRQHALSVSTVSRARDLICGTIGCLPLEMYRLMWNGDDMEPVPLAPRSWLGRIDKSVPNNFILSYTAEDLLLFGRAFWHIQERTADGYPLNFTRLPAYLVQTQDQLGPEFFAPSKQVTFNGLQLDSRDLVQFLSPIPGIIATGMRTIETAIRIEVSRMRNAESGIPQGVLKQTGGEPLSQTDLEQISESFNRARLSNATAVLNEFLSFEPNMNTPDKMLLIDSANYSALDLARLCSVPPYLVGVSTGSYSYQNSQQARQDLWAFGVKPYADCIAETLSSDNILPHGTMVKFDVDDYLAATYIGGDLEEEIEVKPTPSAPGQPSDMPSPEYQ